MLASWSIAPIFLFHLCAYSTPQTTIHLYWAEPIIKYYLHKIDSEMTKGSYRKRTEAHHPVFHLACWVTQNRVLKNLCQETTRQHLSSSTRVGITWGLAKVQLLPAPRPSKVRLGKIVRSTNSEAQYTQFLIVLNLELPTSYTRYPLL